MVYRLSRRQVQKLRQKYRKVKGPRFADRIRIVIAISEGFSLSQLAKIFLIDADTVRRYFRLYQEGGINGFLEIHYEGRRSFLTDAQQEQLKELLRHTISLDVKPIIAYVRETFGIQYSVSGMTKLLHELNFEYKKPKLVPGKANVAAQEEWGRATKRYVNRRLKTMPFILWTECIRSIIANPLMVGSSVAWTRNCRRTRDVNGSTSTVR
jgi:transposase